MKIIAFYLPQFHRIPENDAFWGEGFTEWNHIKDKPTFRHPHEDIGYYNILDFETRRKQGELARKYGIYGFCYYHFWFSGKLVLEKPLQLMLRDQQPDLPFCLAWANENWTRRWDGLDNEILIKQTYGGIDEWKEHLDYLDKFFHHRNYIKIDGQPVFLIYQYSHISPERIRFLEDAGILVVSMVGNKDNQFNTDAKVICEFQPFYTARFLSANQHDCRTIYSFLPETPKINARQFAGNFAGWDNRPRCENTGGCVIVWENCNPYAFGESLKRQHKEEYVFINAWNEWGEQAVLEPDNIYNYSFLEQCQRATK
jgi:lipopolysaccharide biosynthesis protein